MNIVTMKISELKPNPENPRKISKAEMKKLVNGIKEFGLVKPFVVNKHKGRENIIVGGHQRLEAAKELCHETVPIVYVDLPKKRESVLNIALNRISGEFDDDKLFNLLTDLNKTDMDLLLTGLDESEIYNLLKDDDKELDDVPEVPKIAKSKLGEIYLLGNHRIMCGNAINKSDVEKLMDGETPDLVLTDPPYGIGIVKTKRPITKSYLPIGFNNKKGSIGADGIVKVGIHPTIIGDDKPFNPSHILRYGKNQIIWGGNYFASKLVDTSCWLIWDKRKDIPSNNFADCEIAWTSFNKASRIYAHVWSGLIREGQRSEELKKRQHPTQKPVGVHKAILKDFSTNEDKILDLYAGSGTTLIACEALNRKSYHMELSFFYIDVILDRWSDYTGKDPVRLSDNKKWSLIKQEK